ncbi:MAG TPA: proton-conducting transporter membrane subunit, partial [Aquabacterium sp.]|nr:proton-conducting transporter membrane subunit [Aquabacterium sp.]
MNNMNWLAVAPEILLLGMACLVTLADLFVTCPRRRPTYLLTMLTLAAVAGLHISYLDTSMSGYAMQGMLVTDAMGHLLALSATLAVMGSLVYAQMYAGDRDMLKGELFSLSLFSLLGISIMIAGNNFLVIYLGLELMSLSLYALVALRRDHAQATEAAMKYFVLGALASGFLLYGLSMMYG